MTGQEELVFLCYRYATQYAQYMYKELGSSLTASLDLVSIGAPFTLVKGTPSGKQTRLFIFNTHQCTTWEELGNLVLFSQ